MNRQQLARLLRAMVQPWIIEQRLGLVSPETHKVAIERARRFVQRSKATRARE